MLFPRMQLLQILLPLALLPVSTAIAAANFNVSAATLQEHGCGPECQEIFTLGLAKDRQLFGGTGTFDFDFYATSSNFTGSQLGDLLKFEPIDPTTLNIVASVVAYRFQYTSRDLDGSLVPATGFIAIPYTSFREDRNTRSLHTPTEL